MNLNRTKKLFSMVCVCSMLTIGSAQAAFAGPSTGYESDMVATVAADLSIYADEDENSEVVAMAEKGESYDVVGKADDSWIKVAAGEMEGYLKVQSSVMLSKAEEAAAVADAFVAEQSNLSTREQLVNYALQFVGGRYKFGGSDPHTADAGKKHLASGHTKYVMQHGAGVSLNRSSTSQSKQGTAISADQMQPGDLIFYGSGRGINHVAMYIGDGKVVHASTERTGIKTSPWNYRTPVKIVNVLG